ncbi:MAG TPA: ABC transporter permease [Candidatus Saccharimonadales bacterium]|nr:ABC transporter permease [Candidatus Saccharimonadales bacterium]HSX27507.1 ABC transporter permease [Patescibacteria group bacterium]
MPKWLYTVAVFAKISIRRYFRDKVAIFFTVLFPLIFLVVFGSFSKDNNVSFHIALINQSHSQFAQKFASDTKNSKTFKVNDSTTLDQAKQKMSRSEIDAAIVLPSGFGEVKNNSYPSGQAVIYYDENSAQAAQTLKTVLQGQFEGINSSLVKIQTPFSVASKSTNAQGLSKLDYTVSGLIGFAIIGLGVFGPVNYFPLMKRQGVLRRLHITPLRVWQFFVSSVLSNAVIGLFSIAIMIAVASSPLFHFKIIGNYFELAVFIVLGILTIFGIGLAIGGWAKNENQAAPLANIVVFPMLFLSGTFFPRYAMPEWLQHVTAFLPLTPIIDGIRMIATEGKHLTDIGPQLGLIAIWAVIIYAIAFRVFRWE